MGGEGENRFFPRPLAPSLKRSVWYAERVPVYCNWLQSVEGNIDSTHLGTLHVYYKDLDPVDDGTDRPGYPSARYSLYIRGRRNGAARRATPGLVQQHLSKYARKGTANEAAVPSR